MEVVSQKPEQKQLVVWLCQLDRHPESYPDFLCPLLVHEHYTASKAAAACQSSLSKLQMYTREDTGYCGQIPDGTYNRKTLTSAGPDV